MNKTLSIVIPCHKETEDQMFPLLSSINNQVGIDFSKVEVLLLNDAGEPVSEEYLQSFPNLRDIISLDVAEENGGPGVARQRGLDKAQGEYILFCDADDIIHNVAILGVLFLEAAAEEKADFINTPWLEELVYENGKVEYRPHEQDMTWMHGKMFRVDFLREHDIEFHPDLRVHEDTYFMGLLTAHNPVTRYNPTFTYVWKFVPGSITRRNSNIYSYESIPEFVRAVTLSWEVIEKADVKSMPERVMQLLIYTYFNLQRRDWLKRLDYVVEVEKAVKMYIEPFVRYYEAATEDLFASLYHLQRNRIFAGETERELFRTWFSRIMR